MLYCAYTHEEREMDWRPIEDGLPDFDEYVLWYTDDGNYFIEALDKDGDMIRVKVTHWMPLPPPPKTE